MGQAGSSTAIEGREMHRFSGHDSGVRFCAVGPDGDTLATCSADGTVKLWSISTAELLRTLTGHEAEITACCFSGPIMATSALDKLVLLWHYKTGKRASRLALHSGPVLHCAFSQDGRAMASASTDRTARLYRIKPGAGEFVPGSETKVLSGHQAAVNVVQFSPDNEKVFTGSEDETVLVWDRQEGNCIRCIKHPFGRVKGLRFWPKEPFFATMSAKHIVIYSVNSFGIHRKIDRRSERPLELCRAFYGSIRLISPPFLSLDHEAFAFSPDGNYLVGVCSDSKVHVWQLLQENPQPQIRYTTHEGGIQACSFDLQGNHFITADNHGETIIWV